MNELTEQIRLIDAAIAELKEERSRISRQLSRSRSRNTIRNPAFSFSASQYNRLMDELEIFMDEREKRLARQAAASSDSITKQKPDTRKALSQTFVLRTPAEIDQFYDELERG